MNTDLTLFPKWLPIANRDDWVIGGTESINVVALENIQDSVNTSVVHRTARKEFWQDPEYTLKTSVGSAEDIAIVKMWLCNTREKIALNRLALVICETLSNRMVSAVLRVGPYILDNRSFALHDIKYLIERYEPIYEINPLGWRRPNYKEEYNV